MRSFTRIFVFFFLIFLFFNFGCLTNEKEIGETKKEDKSYFQEKKRVEDIFFIVNEEFPVTSKEVELYMQEIQRGSKERYDFDELKYLAINRAIDIAIVELYFEEEGVYVTPEEVKKEIARFANYHGLRWQDYLNELLREYYYREIERDFALMMRVRAMSEKMSEEKNISRKKAEEIIFEELCKRREGVELIFLRKPKQRFWI
jgi:hypothetical protein